jgi:copper transport protein
VALACPGAALAHATLVETTPANDAVLQRAPRTVTLVFDEPVETSLGSVRAYDDSAHRVDTGSVRRPGPDEVAVGLRPGLGRGTYTVTWRVVSIDTHTVHGAFVFHVGQPKPGANAGVAAQVLAEEQNGGGSAAALDVTRFLGFSLILLCFGGVTTLAFVLPEERDPARRRLLLTLALAAFVLVPVSLIGIVLQGASAAALGFVDAARWNVVSAVLDSRFGKVWLARAALGLGLCVVALLLRRRRTPLVLDVGLLLGVGLVLTPALAGHANVSGVVSFVADVAHVQAAAIWTGGLAFLLLTLLWAEEERWTLAARAVPRFSILAVGSVGVLLVAGVVNGYLQVRTWRGLWETTYGLLLLTKVALVLPLLLLGLYNNRVSVPRLRAGVASALERRRFLRTSAAEVALMVVIVAVTAVLVSEPPARAQVAPRGPYAADTKVGPFELKLVVDPATAGSNKIDLSLLDSAGRPARADEVRATATLASAGIGPIRLQARQAGRGHFVVPSASLAIAGDWRFQVAVRRGEFDEWITDLSVPIRKD